MWRIILNCLKAACSCAACSVDDVVLDEAGSHHKQGSQDPVQAGARSGGSSRTSGLGCVTGIKLLLPHKSVMSAPSQAFRLSIGMGLHADTAAYRPAAGGSCMRVVCSQSGGSLPPATWLQWSEP